MRKKRIITYEGEMNNNNNNDNRYNNYIIRNLNINNNYNNINNINNNHISNYNNNLLPNNNITNDNINLHSSISFMNPKTSFNLPSNQNIKINTRSRSNKKKVEFEKKKELEKIKKDNELKEQLKDHFKCYICLEKVKKPKMCPYCKRNSCEKCIYKWIETHSNCGICKHSLSKNDLVEIPFLDEMSSFFMKDIDNKEKFQKMISEEESNKKNKAKEPKNSGPVKLFNMMPNKKEENKNKNIFNNFNNNISNNISNNINNNINNNFDDNININYNIGNNSRTIIYNNNNNNLSNIIEMNDGEDEELCLEHNKKLEFFCIQCNKYFCGECLVFFGEEVKKHKNHFVIMVNKLNDPRIKEAEIEYRKLPDTRKKIIDCIGLCNMKIKQNEIQKYEAIKILNYIKSFYINKIENESQKVRYSLNTINTLKYEFEKKKNDIFNKYSNLLNQNNSMAYQQMLQELQALNNSASTANTDVILFEGPNNSPKLFTENYQSDFLEFNIQTMPNGRISEGAVLVNFNINRIPETSCQLNIKHSHDIVTISFRASIFNPSIEANLIAYLIFKNPELGLEFIDLTENYSLSNDGKEQTNIIRLDAKKFLLLCDERKNIYFKIFITKSFYK